MKQNKSFNSAIWLLLGSVLLAGCAAPGPLFKPVDLVPPTNKGVVYIYRQPGIVGSAVYGTVTANNKPITKIMQGGYFPYISDPGPVHFEVSTEATNAADVVVETGVEKYLKTTVGMGFFIGHLKFSEVSPDIGRKEITECKLLEPIQL